MIVLWIVLGVIALLGLIVLIWYIATYNQFMRLKNSISESGSAIDISLKKRFDLIPNLVETVKGYASHEKDTLTAVINARNGVSSAKTPEGKVQAENQLTGALRQLFAVAEAYPELKSNENFMDMHNQLKAVETEIANARRYCNAVIKRYNDMIDVFPSNIIARQKHFEKASMFVIDDPIERQAVKVKF